MVLYLPSGASRCPEPQSSTPLVASYSSRAWALVVALFSITAVAARVGFAEERKAFPGRALRVLAGELFNRFAVKGLGVFSSSSGCDVQSILRMLPPGDYFGGPYFTMVDGINVHPGMVKKLEKREPPRHRLI